MLDDLLSFVLFCGVVAVAARVVWRCVHDASATAPAFAPRAPGNARAEAIDRAAFQR